MSVAPGDGIRIGRRRLLLTLFGTMALVLVARAIDLQVLRRAFLQGQGEVRQHRLVSIPAHRGMILDRNGEPLAVSTPVDSVWADPRELIKARAQWPALAQALKLETDSLERKLVKARAREFVYLKRHVGPQLAQQVLQLDAPGVSLQREYRRYYPAGEVTSHLLGFTNIDDQGQEGLELAFDSWLSARSGLNRVIQDRLGRPIADVASIRPPRPGQDLRLSIDRRLQYLAYRELKAGVQARRARSGSVVMIDVNTGEMLAMVNQPAYNPNNRRRPGGQRLRNRVITDVLEPGSTVKPFTILAALRSGQFRVASQVETSPGYLRMGRYTIRDRRNFGRLDLTGVLRNSSNVGASKIALMLQPEQLWRVFDALGFGQLTNSGFPGESPGLLLQAGQWRPVEQATMSYGYGMSVTPLQLVRAYGALATGGMLYPISFRKLSEPPQGRRVLEAQTALWVRGMLEQVVAEGGTAQRAAVAGYRVAGKTGTSRKAIAGGYAGDRYIAMFAGFAPASNPRLAAVVVVDEPQGEEYYGGQVAAPLFSKIMAEALRLLDIAPDNLPVLHAGGEHGADEAT